MSCCHVIWGIKILTLCGNCCVVFCAEVFCGHQDQARPVVATDSKF